MCLRASPVSASILREELRGRKTVWPHLHTCHCILPICGLAGRCICLCCGSGLDPSDINNAPFLWHKGEDFQKAGTSISLLYRMATSADVKPPRGQKFSRYLWKMPVKKVRH